MRIESFFFPIISKSIILSLFPNLDSFNKFAFELKMNLITLEVNEMSCGNEERGEKKEENFKSHNNSCFLYNSAKRGPRRGGICKSMNSLNFILRVFHTRMRSLPNAKG